MESAFGIEHGEVSKAFGRRKQPPPPPSYAPAAAKLKALGQRVGTAPISLQGVGNTAGNTAHLVGRGLKRFPAVTGTAVLGGAGYTAYKKTPRKKKEKKHGGTST